MIISSVSCGSVGRYLITSSIGTPEFADISSMMLIISGCCIIICKLSGVYLGCADSFQPGDDKDSWSDWDFIITTLLEADVWVTLDFDSKYANHKWIHDNGWTDYAKFVPMIAVRLPYIKLFNYNTTLKLDDKSFEGTNTGVWCHQLHDLKDRTNYTDWSEYVGDEVIE